MDARPLEKRPQTGPPLTRPSFLIVRFSAIGDCVMAAYTATAIRKALPESKIVWAVDSRCRPVLADSGLVDDFVEFPRDDWRTRRWSPSTWREQLGKFSRLRKMRLDVGLDLQGHSKTALCLRIAAPRKRLSAFSTDPFAARLNPQLEGDPNGAHRVERMLAAAQQFGTFQVPKRPIMPALPGPSASLITISTGAGATNKIYPAKAWIQVARHFVEAGFQIQFLGAGPDPSVEVPGTKNWVGKLTLRESMAKIACSVLHLAGDTGSGHIAAAYGVPVVSIFGPTDPRLFRPYSEVATVLKKSDRTADCSAEEVISAAEALLAAHE
jgi:ADP-heptose:LPS heptosyltransferase